MNDIREYLNLIEKEMNDPENMQKKSEPEHVPTEKLGAELSDNTPLQGSIDARGLAALLPEITDVNRFVTGVAKVKNGSHDRMSFRETTQLALAFVSLLRDPSKVKQQAIRRIARVQTADHDK